MLDSGFGLQLTRTCLKDKHMNKYIMCTYHVMLIKRVLQSSCDLPCGYETLLYVICLKQWPREEFGETAWFKVVGNIRTKWRVRFLYMCMP